MIILLDDVGFGMASTFGGPVPTPNFDRLAANGLKYNQFHTTALCSPTRGALLAGRNHHTIGTGVIIEMGTGYPGYTGIIPKSTALVSQTLRDNGFATSMFGKWHNTPEPDISPAGPFAGQQDWDLIISMVLTKGKHINITLRFTVIQ
jgi:arylsulfatase